MSSIGARWWPIVLIVMIAGALRFHDIGGLSFWYDEVVTMRLARQPGPVELLRLLGQIDATRAPLHALLLQTWVSILGPSEASSRAFSAVCGLLTVVLIHRIGREGFDEKTGLWAAALAAISPLLVQYSREVRMYALLTLLTCLAWWLLLSFRRAAPLDKQVLFTLTSIALAYSHPLGMLMVGTLALAYLSSPGAFRLTSLRWLGLHMLVLVAIAPWVPHYLDHSPEFLTGRLPIRFLLGLPIGLTGGNGLTLAGFAVLIARASVATGWAASRRLAFEQPTVTKSLLIWFLVPPSVLYGYSLIGHPIFGPARYTLFVGPAYLLLLARGLVQLTPWLRGWVAVAIVVMGASQLRATVYSPDLKADWRGVARMFETRERSRWTRLPTVIVFSADPNRNVEVETARYYLGRVARVVPSSAALDYLAAVSRDELGPLYLAVGVRDGNSVAIIPEELSREVVSSRRSEFSGLRLIHTIPRRFSAP